MAKNERAEALPAALRAAAEQFAAVWHAAEVEAEGARRTAGQLETAMAAAMGAVLALRKHL